MTTNIETKTSTSSYESFSIYSPTSQDEPECAYNTETVTKTETVIERAFSYESFPEYKEPEEKKNIVVRAFEYVVNSFECRLILGIVLFIIIALGLILCGIFLDPIVPSFIFGVTIFALLMLR